jgi:hypothetical protein
MSIVRFKGRTFPQRIHVEITLPSVRWEDQETGLIMDFKCHVGKGNVDIECTTNKFVQEEHLIPIYNRAFDTIRSGLDLISFSTGRPFTVILEKFIRPDGFEHSFGVSQLDLARFCTAIKPDDSYNRVLKIIMAEWPLLVAVRDLIETITIPHRCEVNCARVIDTLRHQLTNAGDDRQKGWEELRTKLNVSKEFLQYISEASRKPRHGNLKEGMGHVRREVTERTWQVMNRFLEFRMRGNTALPLAEFPLLTG